MRLGWADQLYLRVEDLHFIDLNASVFRRKDLLSITPPADVRLGDFADTALVERDLPAIASFAGLGDYSYSLYDWLNRNYYCPAVPPDQEAGGCHVYGKWLGAALNSTHFGDQAEAVYKHYHRIAMQLARRANAMLAQIETRKQADPSSLDEREARVFVREAEVEALIYEAIAQHYLQDRWSMGHMWNRWNGPRWDSEPTMSLIDKVQVGLTTGLVHGAEAVLKDIDIPTTVDPKNVPDPMCSPVIDKPLWGNPTATPVEYTVGGVRFPGVGDYRFHDMMRGKFGGRYGYRPEMPLRVVSQRASLLSCSQAGWGEVARAFYRNPSDGLLGEHRLDATAAPSFDDLDCWSHWATNEAMYHGYKRFGQRGWQNTTAGAVRYIALYVGTEFGDNETVARLQPGKWERLLVDMKEVADADPHGTTLADGTKLKSFGGAKPGNHYLQDIPTGFHEPADATATELDPFHALPDHSDKWRDPSDDARPGRDKHTIHGFFNRSHADYWCQNAQTKLTVNLGKPDPEHGLRAPVPMPDVRSNDDQRQHWQARLDTCELLADRLHKGTRAFYLPEGQRDYEGESHETRRLDHGGDSAEDVVPPCEVFDALPKNIQQHSSNGTYWQDNPYELHPGYIGADHDSVDNRPYAVNVDATKVHYASIRNWCRSVPVINIDSEDVAVDGTGEAIEATPGYDKDRGVTFGPEDHKTRVTIHGFNFGVWQPGARLKFTPETLCTRNDTIYIDKKRPATNADPNQQYIVEWRDDHITFEIKNTLFLPDFYRMTVIRADRDLAGKRIRSVGLARLNVSMAAYSGVSALGKQPPLPVDTASRAHRAVHPFCRYRLNTPGEILAHTAVDCTNLDPSSCGTLDRQLRPSGDGELLWKHGDRVGVVRDGPYALHKWQVKREGQCQHLPFSAQCPIEFLADWFGLLYIFERTDTETPVSEPERRWRHTLVWKRPDFAPE